MILQPSYKFMSDVPTGYKDAYEEEDGKAVFVGGKFEFKTEAELEEVKKAKQKAFSDFHDLKNSFKGVDVEKHKKMLDELDVLRAKVKDGTDEETVAEIVKTRVARETEELTKSNTELTEQLNELNNFKTETQKETILNEVLEKNVSEAVIDDAKFIIGSAIERQADGTYVSNGKAGFEKGLPLEKLVSKAVELKAHWKKQSLSGHGVEGSDGGKPTTKQQRLAELLAKEVNTAAEKNEMTSLASEIDAGLERG